MCLIILIYCKTGATCRRKRKLSMTFDLREAPKSWGPKFFTYSLAMAFKFLAMIVI